MLGWTVELSDPGSRSPEPGFGLALVMLPASTRPADVVAGSSWKALAGAKLVASSVGPPRLALFLRGREAGSASVAELARTVFSRVRAELR